MKTREIFIVTGWGGPLGTGHVQRMAALADHVNRHTNRRAFLVCDREPGFLPDQFKEIISGIIRPGTAVVIRDKRDSDAMEMKELKSHGPLIAVDDCGPGRDLADRAIDLLPNLKYSINKKELFLYGYTFVDSIRRLDKRPVPKEIDYALYFGINPSRETVDRMLSLIPGNRSCAILTGNTTRLIKQGKTMPLQKSYAETLLSAKVLISHFGITLYEGRVAGCRLITINPTDYHSRLSDRARHDLDLINLGVMDAVDTDHAGAVISETLNKSDSESIDPALIIQTIEEGIDIFLSRINLFL